MFYMLSESFFVEGDFYTYVCTAMNFMDFCET